MNYIDVFNGDADGLCALVQLRRRQPRQAQLVTGIKRDINLLKRVQAGADTQITVLDISFAKNAQDVERLLAQGARIDYIDHHQCGEITPHQNLHTAIDLDADTCTSLIVDQRLQGQYRAWAITAAFGDNLTQKATALAQQSGFTASQTAVMKQLGVLLNYNGYGSCLADLFFDPAQLYKKLQPFDTPFQFLESDPDTFSTLNEGYQQDMQRAEQAAVIHQTPCTAVIELPDEVWARRVSGVFSNRLANEHPQRAHAVLIKKESSHYLVSVRAPLSRKSGADELVSQFPGGGGRKAAAGINQLPVDKLAQFIAAMDTVFARQNESQSKDPQAGD